MGEWSTVAVAGIAGGTGVLTALIGYWSGRRGLEVELTKTTAEMDRLRATHDEAHTQHREGVYHSFLDCVYMFNVTSAFTSVTLNPMTRREWARQYSHLIAGVNLVGSVSVRDQLRRVESAITDFMKEMRDTNSLDPVKAGLRSKLVLEWEKLAEVMADDLPSRRATMSPPL